MSQELFDTYYNMDINTLRLDVDFCDNPVTDLQKLKNEYLFLYLQFSTTLNQFKMNMRGGFIDPNICRLMISELYHIDRIYEQLKQVIEKIKTSL